MFVRAHCVRGDHNLWALPAGARLRVGCWRATRSSQRACGGSALEENAKRDNAWAIALGVALSIRNASSAGRAVAVARSLTVLAFARNTLQH
jgi:hypothetical protein